MPILKKAPPLLQAPVEPRKPEKPSEYHEKWQSLEELCLDYLQGTKLDSPSQITFDIAHVGEFAVRHGYSLELRVDGSRGCDVNLYKKIKNKNYEEELASYEPKLKEYEEKLKEFNKKKLESLSNYKERLETFQKEVEKEIQETQNKVEQEK